MGVTPPVGGSDARRTGRARYPDFPASFAHADGQTGLCKLASAASLYRSADEGKTRRFARLSFRHNVAARSCWPLTAAR